MLSLPLSIVLSIASPVVSALVLYAYERLHEPRWLEVTIVLVVAVLFVVYVLFLADGPPVLWRPFFSTL